MKKSLDRRHFLRGTGTLIALPAMESLGFRRQSNAAEGRVAKPPKRMIFLGCGFGVTKETWFPSLEQTGPKLPTPRGPGSARPTQIRFHGRSGMLQPIQQ